MSKKRKIKLKKRKIMHFNDLEDKTILKTKNNIDNKITEVKGTKKGRPKGYRLKDEKEKVKVVSFSLQVEVLDVFNKYFEEKKKEDNTLTKSKVLNNILKEYFKEKGMM